MTEEVIRSALSFPIILGQPSRSQGFFDNSFLTELEESGFIKELYAKR
jgi:hypothetical protein